MPQLKPVRLLMLAVALTGAPLVVSAQTQPSTPPLPSASPPATQPEATPLPPAAVPQRPVDKSVTGPTMAKSLVGLVVFSSDGSKMGTVQSVNAAPDGSIKAINIKTGGFLGFGTRLVAIPEGRFAKTGDAVQLGMTADEVGKLPEVKEQS